MATTNTQSSPLPGLLALGGLGVFAASKILKRRKNRSRTRAPSRRVAELRDRTDTVVAERRLRTETARLERQEQRIADEAARRQRRQTADLARVDREKARLEARASRLSERASRTGSKRAERSVQAAENRIDDLDAMAKRIENRNVTPEELRELMANGSLRINPEDAAEAQSATFNGRPLTVRLTPAERKPLPAEMIYIGTLESFVYEPSAESQRGDSLWKHTALDRGDGQPKATHKAILVADPTTERIQVLRGDERFDPARGVVG